MSTKKDEIDPTKEKARLKSEIRRMREAYKRGLYEDDEHTFWRAATMEEKAALCQIILKQVVYAFKSGEIVKVIPKAEYEVLFGMANSK